MKIYSKNLNNISIIDTLFNSPFSNSYKKTHITRIYSKSGIFVLSQSDDTAIYKLDIIDKPLKEINTNHSFIIDDSEIKLLFKSNQIPFHHHTQNVVFHIFTINSILDINLIIEEDVSQSELISSTSSKDNHSEKNPDIYFYVKNSINDTNNMDNIIKEISTFLSSFNFY